MRDLPLTSLSALSDLLRVVKLSSIVVIVVFCVLCVFHRWKMAEKQPKPRGLLAFNFTKTTTDSSKQSPPTSSVEPDKSTELQPEAETESQPSVNNKQLIFHEAQETDFKADEVIARACDKFLSQPRRSRARTED